MRAIVTIFIVLFSVIEFQAQEICGYFVREGIYSPKDDAYSENNISGNSITVEFFISEATETNIIRVGHKTKIGTIYHDYIVVATEIAKSKEDYNIIVANDKFGGDIAFKYNNEDFVLLYNYDEKIEKWGGFYAGMLLNNNTISFLSAKKPIKK